MVVMRAALLASVFALAACDVGEVPIEGGATDGGGSGDPMASAMYTAMVVPIVGATGKNCTQAAPCHGGGQSPAMLTFESLTNNGALKNYAQKPSTTNRFALGPLSIDVATGKHPSPATYPQAVVYLDATQKATIAMWIDMYGF
jgi:hypothetical protein